MNTHSHSQCLHVPRPNALYNLLFTYHVNPCSPVDILLFKYASLHLANKRVMTTMEAARHTEVKLYKRFQNFVNRSDHLSRLIDANEHDIHRHQDYCKRLSVTVSDTSRKSQSGNNLTEQDELQHVTTLVQYHDALSTYIRLQYRKKSLHRKLQAYQNMSVLDKQTLIDNAIRRYETQRIYAMSLFEECEAQCSELNRLIPLMRYVLEAVTRRQAGGGVAPVAIMRMKTSIVVDTSEDEQGEILRREREAAELYRLSRAKEAEGIEAMEKVIRGLNRASYIEGSGVNEG